MRELLGDAKAIVASTKKVGGPGTRLDVPITHINASYVRSHFDAMEVGLADAPRAARAFTRSGDDDRGARACSRRPALKPQTSRERMDCDETVIRKIAVFVEETHSEMGRKVQPPTRRAAAVAVIENPAPGSTWKIFPN